MTLYIPLLLSLFGLSSLDTQTPTPNADKIINLAIEAHGGDLYNQANYEFVFRGKTYRFQNNGDQYSYEVESEKDGKIIHDKLDNTSFTRRIDGKEVDLETRMKNGAKESLNSVIYFATLPHKLNDAAVNKSYVNRIQIKETEYDVIQITFDQEGGGKDYDDTYYYWINADNYRVDFLAYNYSVNGGGVRFRSAQNTRDVDGILFQDYINYKAEVGTPLGDLPSLWEEGNLIELSKILTENIKNLAK